MSNVISCLIAGFIPIVVYAGYLVYKYNLIMAELDEMIAIQEAEEAEKEFEDKLLFFNGTEVVKCNEHKYGQKLCSNPDCSFGKFQCIVELFKSSKKSLDIIINLITSEDIVDAILNANQRGVIVRIICDHGMSTNSGSDIELLIKNGIFIKTSETKPIHAKLAIVDRKVLMTGSINWTFQGVHKNFDNLLFISSTEIVNDAVNEFNCLWNSDDTVMFTKC